MACRPLREPGPLEGAAPPCRGTRRVASDAPAGRRPAAVRRTVARAVVLVLGLWLGVLGGFGEPVAARVVDSEPIGAMIETLDFNLYSPNSGGAFDSTGWPPNPSGDLASLRDGGGSSNAPLGQQTDPTTVPPSNADEQRVTDPDAGSLDGALHLFWQKGSALGGVAFDRYLVAWKSGQEEFQTDPIGDRVKVVMGRNIHDVIVEGLANGTEYTVRVTHANSVGPAVHSSREVTATPAERVRELVSNASMQVYIDEFDKAYEEGTMFLLTTHPHIIGHRSRMVILEELVDHIKARGDVWFATHEQVARYVKEQAGL